MTPPPFNCYLGHSRIQKNVFGPNILLFVVTRWLNVAQNQARLDLKWQFLAIIGHNVCLNMARNDSNVQYSLRSIIWYQIYIKRILHWDLAVKNRWFLVKIDHFSGERLISRNSDFLNMATLFAGYEPVWLFLWGFLKSRVYDPYPKTTEELKTNIRRECKKISEEIITSVTFENCLIRVQIILSQKVAILSIF